jgi:N-acetylmuramoyl-L-alanine amidase CwlA
MVNITKDYLTPNKWSRPQKKIVKVKGIVIHWVANPNTTAANNRNFFESRKLGTKGFGSAHFIVGQQGEIIQCMPLEEMAYHVGSTTYTADALKRLGSYPNELTLGIECCHIDWEGNMKDTTYNSIVDLTAYLLKQYNLSVNDIWTHQLVVGWKDCHRLFYKHPELFTKFKNDVDREMKGTITPTPSAPKDIPATYVMKAGDTLYSISREFGVSVDELKRLNPTLDVTAIPIGTVIKLKNVVTPTPTPTPVATTPKYNLPTGTFAYGSRGESVKQIQNALNKLYFNVGTVDGVYGSQTRNAVYRYQSMYKHLVNDGIYGNATRTQMLSDLNK